MAKSDGAVYITTLMDTKGFMKGMNTVENRVANLTGAIKKLGGVIASAFAVQKLVQFGREAIELGSDLQEVQNVVDVTFTTMSEQVNEFAKNAAIAAGLSETMAKRYVGTFGAMSKAFGFAESEAFAMSTALTQLAGDVASFYNISQDEAYTKLKSVFTGETETLKDLGVVMTQNALDSYALAKGMGKTTKQMSEQEKVALRYSFVLDKLSAAQGDFARTSDSWANQTRVLSLNFDTFKANIGQALINIFTPFLKVINQIVDKMAQLSSYFVAFSEMLVGKSTSGGGGSPGAVLKDMASGYDDVADSAKKAEKAQNQYLSGLDEIRTFTQADKEEGKTGGGFDMSGLENSSSILSNELRNTEDLIAELEERFPKLIAFLKDSFSKIKEIIDDFRAGDFFEAGQDISDLVVGIFDFFSDAIDSVDWQGIGNKIGDFLAGIDWLRIIKSALTLKFNIWKAIAELWFGSFQKAPFETLFLTAFGLVNFTPIGKLLSTKLITSFLNALKKGGLASKLVEAFSLVIGGAGTLKEVFDVVFGPLATTITGIISIVGGAVIAVSNFVDMLNNGFDWFNELIMIVGIGLGALGAILLGAPATVAGVVAAIVASIATLVIVVKDNWQLITDTMTAFDDFLQNVFAIDWTENFGALGEVFNAFSYILSDLWNNGIKKTFTGIIDFITGIFTGNWKKAWEGVKNIFAGVMNTFEAVAKAPINAVIGAFNGLISGLEKGLNHVIDMLNEIEFDVPDWIPGIGGKSFDIDIPKIKAPKIPYLATGAVIPPNAPFVAMLGDQKHGNNIEAPEDLIRKIVREETGGANISGNVTIPVYFDGNKLFEIMIAKAKLLQASTGTNMFVEL